MIDAIFLTRKVELIQEELKHLTAYAEFSFEEVAADYVKQAVIERILERVISRAIDINQHVIAESSHDGLAPMNYRDTFTALTELGVYPKDFSEQISKSIGTRNRLVHEYDKADGRQIYDSIKDCLKDYAQYCGYIIELIKTQPANASAK